MAHAIFKAALVGTAALSTFALAQTIELSSESIGTVRVDPGTIATPAPTRASGRARTVATTPSAGVDLGIRRNPDGTLFDALDPTQNPAAAPAAGTVAPTTGTGNATTRTGTNGSANATLVPGPASGPGSAAARSIGGELGRGAGGELGAGTGGSLGGASTSNVGTGPTTRSGGASASAPGAMPGNAAGGAGR